MCHRMIRFSVFFIHSIFDNYNWAKHIDKTHWYVNHTLPLVAFARNIDNSNTAMQWWLLSTDMHCWFLYCLHQGFHVGLIVFTANLYTTFVEFIYFPKIKMYFSSFMLLTEYAKSVIDCWIDPCIRLYNPDILKLNLVKDTGENNRPVASHWQSRLGGIQIHNISGDRHWLHRSLSLTVELIPV
jgi:hypothetical protein